MSIYNGENHSKLLDKYARLVVETGINLQNKQILIVNSPIECADFARRISSAGFDAGAKDVHIVWGDEKLAHLRYEKGDKEIFSDFPEWRRIMYTDYAEKGAAFVSISAGNPELFKDIDPEKMQLAQKAAGAALIEYRQRIMRNDNSWCVVSIPTAGWAKKVFPDKSEEDAISALWEKIFMAVRVDKDTDPVDNWQKHAEFLKRAADFMNNKKFVSLHYNNSMGTNLTVKLPKGHIWAGGAEYTTDGVRFIANMPTEEVYTLPDRDGVDGRVYATKPLHYSGTLIEGIRLDFKDGKVVEAHADKGEELLKNMLKIDEGSCRLGECALVPFDSPISNSGVLFYNTLFDENAACHLALGKAYPTCLEGGEKMDSVTLLQHGVNDSLIHEDFMIGSADMSIIGTTEDGDKVPVFENGNFVEF